MSSGQRNLKQQGDTTTHPLEWPTTRTLTPPNAGDNVEEQEHSLLVGRQNDTTTSEHIRMVSYKTNPALNV